MKQWRMLLWLLVLPGLLLFAAWQLGSVMQAEQARVDAEQAAAERAQRRAAAEVQAQQDALQRHIDQRRAQAQDCADQALRGLGLQRSGLLPMLFILGSDGCGEGCDSEAIAQRLVNEYYLEGLQVVLIRTRNDIRDPRRPPAGVPTVTIPSCARLVAELGDDYFLRHPDGSLQSSGHRHETQLREQPEDPPPFDPEGLLRSAMP